MTTAALTHGAVVSVRCAKHVWWHACELLCGQADVLAVDGDRVQLWHRAGGCTVWWTRHGARWVQERGSVAVVLTWGER